MEATFSPLKCGIQMALPIAIVMSGCDTTGPEMKMTPDGLSGSIDVPITNRDSGVELSKRASDELADFVRAVQFDAVFPMSVRIHALSERARQGLSKRLAVDRRRVEVAVNVVEAAGSGVTTDQVQLLEQANRQFLETIGLVLHSDEIERVAAKARQLVDRFPEIRELSQQQLTDILRRYVLRDDVTSKDAPNGTSSFAAADTSDGDGCTLDCSVTAVISYGGATLAYAAALWGCGFTSAAYLACFGVATGIKYYAIGAIVWDLYTCTKKCG